jgi:hypothetical protein
MRRDDMKPPIAIFLCDESGIMAQPWAEAGIECYCVDVKHSIRRKPNHYFHPWQYTGFELGDNYTKKTCIWSGNGFVMPEPKIVEGLPPPDNRIHAAPPTEDRAAIRSKTPAGFARAVFEANFQRAMELAA